MEQQALTETLVAARVPLGELEDGQRVGGVYAVRERELRRKRNGEPWLRLVLGDASGSAEAVCWEEAEARYALAAPGTAVFVTGVFEVSERWGAKIKIAELREADADEYEAEDLAPESDVSFERLEGDLRELLATIQDRQLRDLLDRFFGEGSEIWARFRDAPAAKVYHQAYRHGLLEHTLSVAQAVSAAADFFPGIDRDVAVTGALLHDIGKTEAYNDDPLAIDLTDAGRLQGEIPLGYYLVRRQIEEIPGFDPALAQARAPHHPQPPRLARARLAGRPRHPRGRPRPHDRQPRRPPRQLRPPRAPAPRRRVLVGLRPRPLGLGLLRPARRRLTPSYGAMGRSRPEPATLPAPCLTTSGGGASEPPRAALDPLHVAVGPLHAVDQLLRVGARRLVASKEWWTWRLICLLIPSSDLPIWSSPVELIDLVGRVQDRLDDEEVERKGPRP